MHKPYGGWHVERGTWIPCPKGPAIQLQFNFNVRFQLMDANARLLPSFPHQRV